MNHCLSIKIGSLILATTISRLFSAEIPEFALKTKIDNMIAMCDTKIKLVDHKSSLFVHIPEPIASKVPLWESKEQKNSREKKDQEVINRWKAENQRIDAIKDDYLKSIEQAKQWFKKNNEELKGISNEKFSDKGREYVHNCNLFVDGIADELYWFQEKTPPGGFKNDATPKFLDRRFPKPR